MIFENLLNSFLYCIDFDSKEDADVNCLKNLKRIIPAKFPMAYKSKISAWVSTFFFSVTYFINIHVLSINISVLKAIIYFIYHHSKKPLYLALSNLDLDYILLCYHLYQPS